MRFGVKNIAIPIPLIRRPDSVTDGVREVSMYIGIYPPGRPPKRKPIEQPGSLAGRTRQQNRPARLWQEKQPFFCDTPYTLPGTPSIERGPAPLWRPFTAPARRSSMELSRYDHSPVRGARRAWFSDNLTPVQEAVIAPDVATSDLLVSAQTGSGKDGGIRPRDRADPAGRRDPFSARRRSLWRWSWHRPESWPFRSNAKLAWLYARTGAVVSSCVGGMDMRG